MNKSQRFAILAYYYFTDIESPHTEVKKLSTFFQTLDAKGRIYISEEGINGQMSVHNQDVDQIFHYFQSDARFQKMEIKIQPYSEHAFEKMTVKYRKQLAALDHEVDLAKTGTHVRPKQWHEMLKNRNEDTILIDVRNDYEWEVGHFEGAINPKCKTFREFPEYAKQLKEQFDPKKTKVMMYCTGGIRCELYSCLLKEEGFEEVFQLEGGVIKYGLEIGNNYWKGNLFVFDDRLVVPISEQEGEVISHCQFCGSAEDTYFNCANMDCNALFIACQKCVESMKGCCSHPCVSAERRRDFSLKDHPKPFRKLSFEIKQKMKENMLQKKQQQS